LTRVLAVSAPGGLSPSMRVRAVIPSRRLRQYGIEVAKAPLFTVGEYATFQGGSIATRARLTLRARRRLFTLGANDRATVAWIVRRADMLPSTGLEKHLARNRKLIYDIDDAIWFDKVDAGGHRLAFLKGSRRKAKWLAAHADHVIAGNEILASWLSRYGAQLTVIPSLVDTESVPVRRHLAGSTLVLGWIGSATTAPYLVRVAAALERAARELRDIRLVLHVVGGKAPRLRGVRCIEEPWNEGTEREALRSIDIGLMPLPDNRWTRGKCAYKAVQYMASGIPVIADDVGVTRSVVQDCGIVPSNNGAWVEGIVTLARDHELRGGLGAKGRSRAVREFSVEAWAPQLAQILSES
jgi:glycosyltransferase involved in cell wall biosynthesis